MLFEAIRMDEAIKKRDHKMGRTVGLGSSPETHLQRGVNEREESGHRIMKKPGILQDHGVQGKREL